MDEKQKDSAEILSSSQVLTELKRERNKIRFRRIIKYTINTMIVVAAIAVLITSLLLPVLQIAGTSMVPTLNNGDIVVLVKTSKLEHGDLCGFAYSNKILIKRVIGMPGDVIEIDSEGTVSVNGDVLDEDYVTEKGLGECDIEFPYTVPENTYFLMGDQRSTSIDSRSTVIGCVSFEQIIGKLFIRVWPLTDICFLG